MTINSLIFTTGMQPLILKNQIEDLDLSEEIKLFANKHHISTLEKLLEIKGTELLKLEGFSYRMLQHLLAFLHDHNCLHLFKEK